MSQDFTGKTLSWMLRDGIAELTLAHPPCNEIGSITLTEMEAFAAALGAHGGEIRAMILHSALAAGFSAGADLRELYARSSALPAGELLTGTRDFLERIHRVFDALDDAPFTTIAAVHGVIFGGGFELALTADVIIADRTARFGFPELRLGLIPGFGGIPRLKRDVGNGLARDLLLTGRSIGADKALAAGLVSQVVAEGQALRAARSTAAQAAKFDATTARAAKRFVKPIPRGELHREIDIFCDLITRPAVIAALRKFVESKEALPYLP